MPKNLDSKKQYKTIDQGHVAESIELLADQVRHVLEDSRLVKIPKQYKNVTQVVVNGMGGSNLGAGIVKAAFGDKIKVPLSIYPGYRVPAHVNKNTLFLISSYSGTTEEPLSTYREAKKRGAKILGISMKAKSSKLAKLMIKDNVPGYLFTPELNPSGQPRLGLGYSIFGIATLLAKSGLFSIDVKQMKNIINKMELRTRKLRVNSPTSRNASKKLALQLYNKQPVLVAAEHLIGNVRAFRNQINESSKNFSSYLTLPELNHYAMEGLKHPASIKKNMMFVFFDSDLYHKRVVRRSALTKQIIKKNKVAVTGYKMQDKTRLAQAFEFLQVATWTTYYLGILNKEDPCVIPWVDWFKKQLEK